MLVHDLFEEEYMRLAHALITNNEFEEVAVVDCGSIDYRSNK